MGEDINEPFYGEENISFFVIKRIANAAKDVSYTQTQRASTKEKSPDIYSEMGSQLFVGFINIDLHGCLDREIALIDNLDRSKQGLLQDFLFNFSKVTSRLIARYFNRGREHSIAMLGGTALLYLRKRRGFCDIRTNDYTRYKTQRGST